LGLFYDAHSRYDEAIAQIEHAIQLTPDNAQAYSNLGAIQLDANDPKRFPAAETALKKSIELAPSYPAYANLTFLYLAQHRYADAAAVGEKAVQLNDRDYMAWANLAAVYEDLNDSAKEKAARDRELPLLEQAVQQSPRDAGPQARIALLYAKNGQRDQALSRIQTALALSPDDADVLENVGETYEGLHDRKQALEYIQKSLQKGYSLDALKNNPSLKALLSDPNFRPNPK